MEGDLSRPALPFFLSGGGEMGERIRAYDWAQSALGPPGSWPQLLQVFVSVLLDSNQAMHIAWGSEQTLLYNDAYARILGGRHPYALGSSLIAVWPEVRERLTVIIDRLYEPMCIDEGGQILKRNDSLEYAGVSFQYSPIRDALGNTVGLFCPCAEPQGHISAGGDLGERLALKRRLLDQAPGFIAFLAGPEHIYEFVNAAYAKLFGNRDFIGKSVSEAFPDLAGQSIYGWLDEVYQTGQRFLANNVTVRLQESPETEPEELVLDFIYEPITDEAGQVIGIFIEGYDITERQRAQEALRTSEKLFSALAQTVPSHIWMARANGEIYWFNDGCYRYYGAADGELCDEGWAQRVHPDDLPTLKARWTEAITSGKSYEVEKRLRRADGAYRWHLARAVPLSADDGTVLQWIGTSTDIEDQKQAAAQLLQHNEALGQRVEERTAEYDRVWRNSRDLLMVLGADGIYLAVNPAWLEILGYEPDEVVGYSFLDFIWAEDADLTQAAHEQALLNFQLTSLEKRHRHKDGTFRWISWSTSTEGDRVYGYGRDVTSEKVHAEALRHSEERLRQAHKMEAVGQLTSGISHDFNNLLGGIMGSLELIQTRLTQGRLENLERYTSRAMSSAHRAASLVHRLLAFSRRQPLDPKIVDVRRELIDMEELIRRTIPYHAFELDIEEGLWPVRCDPSQLECSVLNLAINARDAMPESGTLLIEAHNRRVSQPHAKAQADMAPGDYVAIKVTDTGTGMPAAIRERVLEPFFTTKPLGQGTGLGLSMIYGFARQSEGRLSIDSKEGEGTTITLYLPRYQGEMKGGVVDQHENKSEQVATTGKVILIVEDDPVVRGLLEEILQESGHRTLAAIDGPSGLDILQSDRCVDLVITDLGLPGFGGQQLVSLARNVCPDLKVLFLSAYIERLTDINSFDGNAHLISKPFDTIELLNKANSILSSDSI